MSAEFPENLRRAFADLSFWSSVVPHQTFDSSPEADPIALENLEIVSMLNDEPSTPVALCRKPGSSKVFVVKAMFPGSAHNSRGLARFCNEIFALSQVFDRNVIRPLEYIRGDGFLGFSMEYAGGGTLAAKLSSSNGYRVQRALPILRDIACGLKAIHDLGFIHCDLKPENILLTTRGRAKISDLGLALPNNFGEEDGTELAGSPEYMSPEHILASTCTARSDIYAFGLVAYELMTGTRPFHTSSRTETLRHRLHGNPPLLAANRPEVSEDLSYLVHQMMQRYPEDRPSDMNEVLAALSAVSISSPLVH